MGKWGTYRNGLANLLAPLRVSGKHRLKEASLIGGMARTNGALDEVRAPKGIASQGGFLDKPPPLVHLLPHTVHDIVHGLILRRSITQTRPARAEQNVQMAFGGVAVRGGLLGPNTSKAILAKVAIRHTSRKVRCRRACSLQ